MGIHMKVKKINFIKVQENDCRHACDGKIQACNVGCMFSYMNYTPRTLEEILVGVEVKE